LDFNAEHRRSPLILELTPLIDVVFLLLLFFMVSTTFVQEPAALEVNLPQSSSTALVPEGSDTEILLSADGRVLLGGKIVDLAELKVELARIAADEPSTQVVIRGDKTVAYQQLINIMSLAQEQGLTQFSLATTRAAENSNAAGP
jgi:biopolymer transport protein ExbD